MQWCLTSLVTCNKQHATYKEGGRAVIKRVGRGLRNPPLTDLIGLTIAHPQLAADEAGRHLRSAALEIVSFSRRDPVEDARILFLREAQLVDPLLAQCAPIAPTIRGFHRHDSQTIAKITTSNRRGSHSDPRIQPRVEDFRFIHQGGPKPCATNM